MSMTSQPSPLEWVYEADLAVRKDRRLETAWLERFDRRVDRLLSSTDSVWDRGDFVGLHFASLYLPLRLFDAAPEDLASRVRHVHNRCEEALWTAAARTPRGPLSPTEQALVDLAFGSRRPPLIEIVDGAWCADVSRVSKALLPLWRTQTRLPFWPALAAHYISFFIDFFFTGPRPSPAASSPVWLLRLAASESHELHDACCVLGNWFSVPSIHRNSSSHPREAAPPQRSPRRRARRPLPRPNRPPRASLEILLRAFDDPRANASSGPVE